MKLQLLVLTLVACASYTQSATTTTAPHMHHEHPESENFSFVYEGSSQAMLVSTGHKCYIWSLTSDEKSTIHTDSGLKTAELRVLNEIGSAYYTTVPSFILNPLIVKNCNRADRQTDAFYLVH